MQTLFPVSFGDLYKDDFSSNPLDDSNQNISGNLNELIDHYNTNKNPQKPVLNKPNQLDYQTWKGLKRQLVLFYHPDKQGNISQEEVQKRKQYWNDVIEKLNERFAVQELVDAIGNGIQIKQNSKAVRYAVCVLRYVLYNSILCANLMAIVHFRSKGSITTTELVGIFILSWLFIKILSAFAKKAVSDVSKSYSKKYAKDCLPQLISDEDLISILDQTNQSEKLEKIKEELKDLQFFVLQKCIQNKKTPYAQVYFDIAFTFLVCASLYLIGKFNVFKDLGYLNQKFFYVSAVVIFSVFCASLVLQSFIELAGNWLSHFQAKAAYQKICAGNIDKESAQALAVVGCTHQEAEKMNEKEFIDKYKKGVINSMKNLQNILTDPEELKKLVTKCIANKKALGDDRTIALLGMQHADKELKNLWVLATLGLELFAEDTIINTLVADVKIANSGRKQSDQASQNPCPALA